MWQELLRPIQSARVQKAVVVLGIFLSFAVHPVALAYNDHRSSYFLFSLLALFGPAYIVGRRLITGRWDAYPNKRDSD